MKPPLLLRQLLLGSALAVFAAACASERAEDTQPPEETRSATEIIEPREALSEELMVSLGLAKNFHQKADVYLQEARVGDAIEALEEILAIRFPDAAEAEDVALDARARLATLLVTAGDLDRAMRIADEGISSATRESFFFANLLSVRADIYQAKAAVSEDPEIANDLRRRAIENLDRSIEVETKIQVELMENRP